MAEPANTHKAAPKANKVEQGLRRPEPAPPFGEIQAAGSFDPAPVLGSLKAAPGDSPIETHARLLSDLRLSQGMNAVQRAHLVGQLQRSYGNAYVQRVLARAEETRSPRTGIESTGPAFPAGFFHETVEPSGQAETSPAGNLWARPGAIPFRDSPRQMTSTSGVSGPVIQPWIIPPGAVALPGMFGPNAKEKKAQKEYEEFVKSNYKWDNYDQVPVKGMAKPGKGNFDVLYEPKRHRLNINVKVAFEFPDDSGAKGVFAKLGQSMRHWLFRHSYTHQVTSAWSRQYQFKNVREPQSVWGKLNPTNVVVNVTPVEKDEHFTILARLKTAGTANVFKGKTELFKGDEAPAVRFNPSTKQGEIGRIEFIRPKTIPFDPNSAKIGGVYPGKLAGLNTYLKRVNNPKFKLEVVGHSSAKGGFATNLAKQRAEAVKGTLTDVQGNHVVTIGTPQVGSKREAQIGASVQEVGGKDWKNVQAVIAHEFGHMIGLDDEYVYSGMSTGDKTEHYDLVKKAFGKEYADQVARVGGPNKKQTLDSASIMDGGNDVRIQHYVTFWDAMANTTSQKATAPTPKFGHDDWKFIG